MTTWRAGPAGEPIPEPAGYSGKPPADLDARQRGELAQFLRAHGDHWLVTGPCLDGGWYATPQHDRGGPRILAPTLAALQCKVSQHDHRLPTRRTVSILTCPEEDRPRGPGTASAKGL